MIPFYCSLIEDAISEYLLFCQVILFPSWLFLICYKIIDYFRLAPCDYSCLEPVHPTEITNPLGKGLSYHFYDT